MKIDFTNSIDKVIISSDVEAEELKIDFKNTSIQTSSLETERIIIRGIDVTDEILELFLKNNLK